jgi:hypothetical protein
MNSYELLATSCEFVLRGTTPSSSPHILVSPVFKLEARSSKLEAPMVAFKLVARSSKLEAKLLQDQL